MVIEEHARLAPSSAHIWVPCPGSVIMQEMFPDNEESEDSKDGNAAHWIAAGVLLAYKGDTNHSMLPGDYLDKQAPNGVIINQEMIDAASEYINDILKIVQKYGLLRELKVEERVYMPQVHRDNWGTCDASLFVPQENCLYVWDFKYGHRYVEIYENWQIIDYAAGLLHNLTGIQDQTFRVRMRVVQPRCYQSPEQIAEHRVLASDLRAPINQLNTSAMEALGNNPKTKTGKHCTDCSARFYCKGAQHAALAGIDYVYSLTDSINVLTPEALSVELMILERAMQAIKTRWEACEQQALAMCKSGQQLNGWNIGETKPHTKWNKPVKEVIALGDLMGKDLRKPEDVITPAQAKNLGIDESVIKSYSFRPKGNLKLKRDDGTTAKRIFSQRG